jgi:hypothetical protein
VGSMTPRADDSRLIRKPKDIVTRQPTTRQLTPDDEERAAVERVRIYTKTPAIFVRQLTAVLLRDMRLLLARATRPHD